MRASPAHRQLRASMVSTAAGPIEAATVGDGPPVLVIHGLPGSWRQAAPLALDLAGDHRVVLPSRPGYGRTPASVGTTPTEQADAFVALLDALGLDGPVGVVGISGGGPSAAALAARHPARTSALVLCCALAPHLMRPPAVLRRAVHLPLLPEAVGAVLHWRRRRVLADDRSFDRRVLAELTPAERARYDADPSRRDALAGFEASHLDAPLGTAGLRNDVRGLGFRPAPPADLSTITAPTLVQHGDADTVVPLDHGRWYASTIAGARLSVFAGAGHAYLLTFRDDSLPELRAALAP